MVGARRPSVGVGTRAPSTKASTAAVGSTAAATAAAATDSPVAILVSAHSNTDKTHAEGDQRTLLIRYRIRLSQSCTTNYV